MSRRPIAIVDYGMGNRRSVEKALEHVGAAAVDHRPTTTCSRSADGDRRARRRRVPGGDAPPGAARPRRAAARARDAGVPLLGICLGMQLLFERSAEHEGATGSGCCPATVDALDAGGRSSRTSAGTSSRSSARSALDRRARRRGGLLPRALVRAEPADEADVVGRGEYGEPFVSVVERGNVFGVQFHPEKSSRDGLRAAAQLRRVCARGAPRVILYPAIDILDGHGGAARRRAASRTQTVYHDDPLDGRPRVGRARARATCTSSTSTAPGPASRASLEHLRRIVHGDRRPGPVRRRAAHAGGACATRCAAGAERVDRRHRRVPRRRLPRRDRSPPTAPRVVVSVDVRGGTVSTAGWTETTQMPAADAIRRLQRPRRALVRLHQRRPRRHARGPGPRRGPARRRGRPRALPLLGRDRRARGPARRWRALRQVNLAGVIVGKALYEGRFTIAEGQAALDIERRVRSWPRRFQAAARKTRPPGSAAEDERAQLGPEVAVGREAQLARAVAGRDLEDHAAVARSAGRERDLDRGTRRTWSAARCRPCRLR